METLYTRALTARDGGRYEVTADCPQAALEGVVRLAHHCGEQPPRWWEVWKKRWPADIMAEYTRRYALPGRKE